MNKIVSQWLEVNRPYSANRAYGQDAPDSVRFAPREGVFLFVAPHAVHHYRDKATPDKQSDARTGGLCELLGEELYASALAASGFVSEWHTWAERTDAFKMHIAQAVRKGQFIVDLHGMSDGHGVDICLGLGEHPSEKSLRMAESLKAALHGYRVSVNKPFSAAAPYTVTTYVQALGGDGLQLEIAARLRDPAREPSAAATFARDLIQALRALQ